MHPAYLLLAGTAGDAPATHLACALRELLPLKPRRIFLFDQCSYSNHRPPGFYHESA